MNLEAWKQRARQLSAQTYALYLAYRHPRTPWYAKVFAALVVGYVFSPIDPIPDFTTLYRAKSPLTLYVLEMHGNHQSAIIGLMQ